MRKTAYLLTALSFFISNALFAFECKFDSDPQMLIHEEHQILQSWVITENTENYFSHQVPNSKSFLDYYFTVWTRVDTDPIGLVKRELQFFGDGPDGYNMKVVIEKRPGTIDRVSCLESLLMSYLTDRYSIIDHPTEFISLVFKREDANKSSLKVYFYTNDGLGGSVQPLTQSIEESVNGGWSFLSLLHNHPFSLNLPNIEGSIAPSGSDVHIFKGWQSEYGLQEFWITNGFDTLRVKTNEFGLFHEAE